MSTSTTPQTASTRTAGTAACDVLAAAQGGGGRGHGHQPGGGVRVVLGTNLVRVFPLLVRALHKITKALRDLAHKFEISFALFWLL